MILLQLYRWQKKWLKSPHFPQHLSALFNLQNLQASSSLIGSPQHQIHQGVHWKHLCKTQRSLQPLLSHSRFLSAESRTTDLHQSLKLLLHVLSGQRGSSPVKMMPYVNIETEEQKRSYIRFQVPSRTRVIFTQAATKITTKFM